jgi:drug/metabolite transporter (DMT)-like permease
VITTILRILGIGLGVFAMVFGEADDSPGLQGIGMILLAAVFFSVFKIVKRN